MILGPRWACSAAPPLSGEWESTIAIEPATGTWSIETDFIVELEFADWIAVARTVFEDGAWKKQDFEIKGEFGDVDLESDLRFEPYKNRFRDWITKFEWESDELEFALTTKLTRTNERLADLRDRAGMERGRDRHILPVASSVRRVCSSLLRRRFGRSV